MITDSKYEELIKANYNIAPFFFLNDLFLYVTWVLLRAFVAESKEKTNLFKTYDKLNDTQLTIIYLPLEVTD